MKNQELGGKLALLLATIIWGSSFIVMKSALDSFETGYILAIRFLGAFALLSVVFYKKYTLLNKTYWKYGFIMGTLLFLAYYVQTIGLIYTTPGKNAFLTASYCILVPFLFWFVAKVKPDRYNIIAAVLCVIGIGFVSLEKDFSMGIGDSLSALCGLFYAFHIVASAKCTQNKEDAMLLTTIQFLFTGMWGLIYGLIFESVPVNVPMESWLGMAYLCIFATATALGLQMYGIQCTKPATAALILSLEAVFGVLFSIWVGAEMMSFKLAIGFIIIFTAIIVAETKFNFLQK